MATWQHMNSAGVAIDGDIVESAAFFGFFGNLKQWTISVTGTDVEATDEVAVDLALLGVPPTFTVMLFDAYASTGTIQPKLGIDEGFAGFDDKVSTAAAAQRVTNVQPFPIFGLGSPRLLWIRPVTSSTTIVQMVLTLVEGHHLRGT